MCGIVGLFIKDKGLEPRLGALTAGMLETMCDRGPDSAGFAVYGPSTNGVAKITVQSANPESDFNNLAAIVSKAVHCDVSVSVRSTHAVLTVAAHKVDAVRQAIGSALPSLRVMGVGEAIEIYKEVGYPTQVSKRFELSAMQGSHAIGHTRMATESAVTTREHGFGVSALNRSARRSSVKSPICGGRRGARRSAPCSCGHRTGARRTTRR